MVGGNSLSYESPHAPDGIPRSLVEPYIFGVLFTLNRVEDSLSCQFILPASSHEGSLT